MPTNVSYSAIGAGQGSLSSIVRINDGRVVRSIGGGTMRVSNDAFPTATNSWTTISYPVTFFQASLECDDTYIYVFGNSGGNFYLYRAPFTNLSAFELLDTIAYTDVGNGNHWCGIVVDRNKQIHLVYEDAPRSMGSNVFNVTYKNYTTGATAVVSTEDNDRLENLLVDSTNSDVYVVLRRSSGVLKLLLLNSANAAVLDSFDLPKSLLQDLCIIAIETGLAYVIHNNAGSTNIVRLENIANTITQVNDTTVTAELTYTIDNNPDVAPIIFPNATNAANQVSLVWSTNTGQSLTYISEFVDISGAATVIPANNEFDHGFGSSTFVFQTVVYFPNNKTYWVYDFEGNLTVDTARANEGNTGRNDYSYFLSNGYVVFHYPPSGVTVDIPTTIDFSIDTPAPLVISPNAIIDNLDPVNFVLTPQATNVDLGSAVIKHDIFSLLAGTYQRTDKHITRTSAGKLAFLDTRGTSLVIYSATTVEGPLTWQSVTVTGLTDATASMAAGPSQEYVYIACYLNGTVQLIRYDASANTYQTFDTGQAYHNTGFTNGIALALDELANMHIAYIGNGRNMGTDYQSVFYINNVGQTLGNWNAPVNAAGSDQEKNLNIRSMTMSVGNGGAPYIGVTDNPNLTDSNNAFVTGSVNNPTTFFLQATNTGTSVPKTLIPADNVDRFKVISSDTDSTLNLQTVTPTGGSGNNGFRSKYAGISLFSDAARLDTNGAVVFFLYYKTGQGNTAFLGSAFVDGISHDDVILDWGEIGEVIQTSDMYNGSKDFHYSTFFFHEKDGTTRTFGQRKETLTIIDYVGGNIFEVTIPDNNRIVSPIPSALFDAQVHSPTVITETGGVNITVVPSLETISMGISTVNIIQVRSVNNDPSPLLGGDSKYFMYN